MTSLSNISAIAITSREDVDTLVAAYPWLENLAKSGFHLFGEHCCLVKRTFFDNKHSWDYCHTSHAVVNMNLTPVSVKKLLPKCKKIDKVERLPKWRNDLNAALFFINPLNWMR